MSGHSKWATTKRHKAVIDSKRSAVFTRLANLITIAAREKGGDPEMNFNLRMAVEKGKAANMPKENIERAIKRGTGELGGAALEELSYEGIGPAQSQFIVKVITDNKNRSASNIRHLFSTHGGSLGSVAWNFADRGTLRIGAEALTASNPKLSLKENGEYADPGAGETFELSLIDANAQDIVREAEGLIVYTEPGDLAAVKAALEALGVAVEAAAIEPVAKETAEFTGEDAEKVGAFIDALEGDEDIADYYTNAELE